MEVPEEEDGSRRFLVSHSEVSTRVSTPSSPTRFKCKNLDRVYALPLQIYVNIHKFLAHACSSIPSSNIRRFSREFRCGRVGTWQRLCKIVDLEIVIRSTIDFAIQARFLARLHLKKNCLERSRSKENFPSSSLLGILAAMKGAFRSTTIRSLHSSTKPFDEIPGPKSYPVVGTLLNYLPMIGKYKFDALHHNGYKKFKEYGPVVKEEIIPGTNVIWIYNPEDVQELLRKEGRYPQRRSHLALEHYRKLRPHIYNTGGLLPTNGKEWYKLRSAFQKGLSSPHTVRRYLPLVNQVIDDFLDFVASDCVNLEQDFLPYLSRVFLEMLALVAFDHRLNSFSEEEMMPDSRCSKLMESAMTINSCILSTDNGVQLWRRFNTPLYNKLSRAHHYLESVALDLIQEKQRNMTECKREESVLEKYLSGDDIDPKDILGMTADMLLAGIDTTTYSTGFMLYHLANNPVKQNNLFEEVKSLVPGSRSEITAEILNNSHYLKAAVKESFRLNPISVGIGRILAEDAVFSNYHVPKGCVVVTQNQVMCRFPKYFKDPDNFIPERWLKSNKEGVNPYLLLPFGHGPRTCIARRLAEQNIQTLIIKLCRRFEIKWEGGKGLDVKTHLINKPNGPLLFKFLRR